MPRTYDEIVAVGETLMTAGSGRVEMTTREALVIAYNAIEDDTMRNIPNRRQALAVIRLLMMNDGHSTT